MSLTTITLSSTPTVTTAVDTVTLTQTASLTTLTSTSTVYSTKKLPSTSTITITVDDNPPTSAALPSPSIIVDDKDSSIQYIGPWFETDHNDSDTTGSFASPVSTSNHGTNAFDAELSFKFRGSAVTVYGSNGPFKSNWTTNYPTWQCFINNSNITNGPIVTYAAPITSDRNWILCRSTGKLPDGLHTLSMKVYVVNQQTLWFDHLQYYNPYADPGAPQNQSILRFESTDPSIVKRPIGAWHQVLPPILLFNPYAGANGTTTYTQVTGAWFELKFSGSSISCYGIMSYDDLPGVSIADAEATYAIDNLPPVAFHAGTSSLRNAGGWLLFQVRGLASTAHTLRVTFSGNSSTSPLAFTYCIQNGLPSVGPAPSSSTTIHREPIIGGIIRALVLIFLLLNVWST